MQQLILLLVSCFQHFCVDTIANTKLLKLINLSVKDSYCDQMKNTKYDMHNSLFKYSFHTIHLSSLLLGLFTYVPKNSR